MEASILLALQSVRVEPLTQFLALVSALGNQAFVWLVIGLVCLFFSEKRAQGICIFLAVAFVFVVGEVGIEHVVARVRPCDAGVGVVAVTGVSHNGFSFPSGHTTSSFACATVIAVMSTSRRAGVAAVCFAVLVAFSRLYLGVHWPTDILGGIVIGVLSGLLVTWVWRAFLGEAVVSFVERHLPSADSAAQGKHSRKTGSTMHQRSLSARVHEIELEQQESSSYDRSRYTASSRPGQRQPARRRSTRSGHPRR